MAQLLLLHHDKAARDVLALMAVDHRVEIARDVQDAKRKILAAPPQVVLVSQDNHQEHATALLRWMRQNTLSVPVVAVLGRTAAAQKPALLKLGVSANLEYPIDRASLNRQVAVALAKAREDAAGPPPITEEELQANLSLLENSLNRRMRCVAGRNQVFIQSILTGSTTTRPRICLRCSLRAEYGHSREVYYEFIRDCCCADPGRCEAARSFNAMRQIG